MQRRFALKIALIFGLIVLLLLPQALLMGLINERASWRQQAYSSIEQSWPGKQTLAGPLISVPYLLTYDVQETITEKDGSSRQVTKTLQEKNVLLVIPKELKIQSQLASSERKRGIYTVPVYGNQLQVEGSFDTQAVLNLIQQNPHKKVQLEKPFLSVLVSDQRGIASPSSLQWGQQTLAFQPSSHVPNASAGMYTYLPDFDTTALQQWPFQFALELRGMAAMDFALLAETSQVDLQANWPHPKFTGELLPEERQITEQGFTAQWRASSFSYNVQWALDLCQQGNCTDLASRSVGFELLQPVDVYQQSERSIKYALLFIVLTFTVLIAFELLKQLQVHPIQYVLVGLALTVFYLLLISLSEHMNFSRAYAIATLASTGLLTVYFSAILHSRRLGMSLGAGLLALYGLLYFLLQAEDQALLLGSLLLFAILAAVMVWTRHVNWYALLNRSEQAGDLVKS